MRPLPWLCAILTVGRLLFSNFTKRWFHTDQHCKLSQNSLQNITIDSCHAHWLWNSNVFNLCIVGFLHDLHSLNTQYSYLVYCSSSLLVCYSVRFSCIVSILNAHLRYLIFTVLIYSNSIDGQWCHLLLQLWIILGHFSPFNVSS